jgi:hypothetical protein
MGELQRFEDVMVLAVNDNVRGFVTSSLQRPKVSHPRIDRIAELGERDKRRKRDLLKLALGFVLP